MINDKAAKILRARVYCLKCDKCGLSYCFGCKHWREQATFKELIKAIEMAIKALEKQSDMKGASND